MKRWLKQTLYRAAANSGWAQRRHARIGFRNVSILMYHSIVREPLPFFHWCAVAEHSFRQQMDYLAGQCEVIRLVDVPDRLADPVEPERPLACITFDDGYRNNADVAFPILQERELPATIFLTTSFLDTDQCIWDGDLYAAIAGSSQRTLAFEGRSFPLGTPIGKAVTYRTVCTALKKMPQSDLLETVAGLTESLEPTEQDTRAFQLLSTEAVREMHQSGLVDFGAHTHTHAILSRLTADQQREEISGSIRVVSDLIGSPCRTFAYPNGQPSDYDAASVETLQRSNIEVATTTVHDKASIESPRLELPRYGVGGDLSDATFQCMVHHLAKTGR